jgi:chemotaxis signal transduction protein
MDSTAKNLLGVDTSGVDTVAGSYLTFRVGNAAFALTVGCVSYITSRDAIVTRTVPDTDHSSRTVFEHDGQPVPLSRFSDLINTHSRTDESAELIKLMDVHKQDHINWIDSLEHTLRNGDPFTKATDPHKCAFGLWYDNYHTEDIDLQKILARFEAPHKHIHSLAESLIKPATDDRKVEEALAILEQERFSTLQELLELFAQARFRLEDMIKPVVIILENQHSTFAIELDSIDGMLEFSKKDWLADVHKNQEDAPLCYDGYFQNDKEELFLRLDPDHLLGSA